MMRKSGIGVPSDANMALRIPIAGIEEPQFPVRLCNSGTEVFYLGIDPGLSTFEFPAPASHKCLDTGLGKTVPEWFD
jgi:hypothetical protein